MKSIQILLLLGLSLILPACAQNKAKQTTTDFSVYKGTAAVTQGFANTTTKNLYAAGQRIAGIGSITAVDGSTWVVPAEVNYTNDSFPFAPDLFNPDGTQFKTGQEALAAFKSEDIVEIDPEGDLLTAYIFADNYFELYINGTPVGKDAIPFTQFNSHIVKFRVDPPFSIAMLLVDWEENLGLGSEKNRGSKYHAGDGGLVMVIKDASGKTIATTGSDWKAQTFYTAPIKDLSCLTEQGTTRSSNNCNTERVKDGSMFFGLHWKLPANWMHESFDDSNWPNATTYTNEVIVVNNKPSYMNFTDIFDDPAQDAEFIWSTNVVLDNEVIVRYRVE